MFLPFVRCVILNGSLASGDHKKSSDIDILIIAKSKRIFTCRFFVNAVTTMLGIKRSSDRTKSHAGKFCFNYFLIEGYLKINYPKEREEYCAQNYSQSQFVAGDSDLFNKFLKLNKQLFNKFSYVPDPILSSRGQRSWRSIIKDCFVSLAMTRCVQNFTELFFGSWFENRARSYQINRIKRDSITKKYPDLIVFNGKELRFHPPKQS